MHVHVHDHHAVGLEVLAHHGEELHGGHLEGNGDVLIGIHHDHIIFSLIRFKIRPAVVCDDRNILRKCEVFMGEIGYGFVYLHSSDIASWKVPGTLGGKCSGAHSENEYIHIAVVGNGSIAVFG